MLLAQYLLANAIISYIACYSYNVQLTMAICIPTSSYIAICFLITDVIISYDIPSYMYSFDCGFKKDRGVAMPLGNTNSWL